MKLETLRERVNNTKAKIEKKQNTITKKIALIEKKERQIEKLGADPGTATKSDNMEARWLAYDIESLREDVERNEREIEEAKASLEKYEAQLAGEIEREAILIREIPETLKKMQAELVKRWDAWDVERRELVRAKYTELGYREFFKKYSGADYELRHKTDEEIHNANMQDAKALIIDLYYRVRKFTGEVTDWSSVRAEAGAQGMTVLNGYITGKEGRARVESILAGGYNIQRLHVRVLVHEF